MWMNRQGVWTDGGVWVFSVWKVECVCVCVCTEWAVYLSVCVCVERLRCGCEWRERIQRERYTVCGGGGEMECVCVKRETVVYVERDIGKCGGRHKCLYMWSNLGRGVEG